MARFLLGINYWPRRSAMYVWQRFDPGEIREDIARIAELGFDVVRFFLRWDAFQPAPDRMDRTRSRRFERVMDVDCRRGLRAMPTLFCGHMSGVNWLPAWTLDPQRRTDAFARSADGTARRTASATSTPIRDCSKRSAFAREPARPARSSGVVGVGSRQRVFKRARTGDPARRRGVERAADGHAARSVGRAGHRRHARRGSGTRPQHPTVVDRRPWAFATMHGYSVYSAFSRGRLDPDVVPFLAALQASCSGKRVLFTEFGNPTCPPERTRRPESRPRCRVLERRRNGGVRVRGRSTGCTRAARSAPSGGAGPTTIARSPSCRRSISRRTNSLSGSCAPTARSSRSRDALARFAGEKRDVVEPPAPIVEEAAFYATLPDGIFDLYRTYCDAHA